VSPKRTERGGRQGGKNPGRERERGNEWRRGLQPRERVRGQNTFATSRKARTEDPGKVGGQERTAGRISERGELGGKGTEKVFVRSHGWRHSHGNH